MEIIEEAAKVSDSTVIALSYDVQGPQTASPLPDCVQQERGLDTSQYFKEDEAVV